MPSTTILMAYGAIVTSILTSLGFLSALVIAYLSSDHTNQSLMIGAVISNFTTTVSFWLGSSFGSQKKDQVIADQQRPPSTAPRTGMN